MAGQNECKANVVILGGVMGSIFVQTKPIVLVYSFIGQGTISSQCAVVQRIVVYFIFTRRYIAAKFQICPYKYVYLQAVEKPFTCRDACFILDSRCSLIK